MQEAGEDFIKIESPCHSVTTHREGNGGSLDVAAIRRTSSSSISINEEENSEMTEMEKQTALYDRIKHEKERGMFVSGWENDCDGIEPKNMADPKEQMLTAAETGDIDLLNELIDRDSSLIQASDSDGYTPLHRAAHNGHVKAVQLLLSAGADPECRTNDGWTALHCAAAWAVPEVVGLLLARGVDVNCRSVGNLTPLHLAIVAKEFLDKICTTVQYLLEAPVQPNFRNVTVSNFGNKWCEVGGQLHNAYVQE